MYLLKRFFEENVMEVFNILANYSDTPPFDEEGLLLLEIFDELFRGVDPNLLIQKKFCASHQQEANETESLSILDHIRDNQAKNLIKSAPLRHSRFSGIYTKKFVDGGRSIARRDYTQPMPPAKVLKPKVYSKSKRKAIDESKIDLDEPDEIIMLQMKKSQRLAVGPLVTSRDLSSNILMDSEFANQLFEFVFAFVEKSANVMLPPLIEDDLRELPGVFEDDGGQYHLRLMRLLDFVFTFFRSYRMIAEKREWKDTDIPLKYATIGKCVNLKTIQYTLRLWFHCAEISARDPEKDWHLQEEAMGLLSNTLLILKQVDRDGDDEEKKVVDIWEHLLLYDMTESGLLPMLHLGLKQFDRNKQSRKSLIDLVVARQTSLYLLEKLNNGGLHVKMRKRDMSKVKRRARKVIEPQEKLDHENGTSTLSKDHDNDKSTGLDVDLERQIVDDEKGIAPTLIENNLGEDGGTQLADAANEPLLPSDEPGSTLPTVEPVTVHEYDAIGELPTKYENKISKIDVTHDGEQQHDMAAQNDAVVEDGERKKGEIGEDEKTHEGKVSYKMVERVLDLRKEETKMLDQHVVSHLSWLLKDYQYNSNELNDIVVYALRRILDPAPNGLGYAPMLWQLSILQTCHKIFGDKMVRNRMSQTDKKLLILANKITSSFFTYLMAEQKDGNPDDEDLKSRRRIAGDLMFVDVLFWKNKRRADQILEFVRPAPESKNEDAHPNANPNGFGDEDANFDDIFQDRKDTNNDGLLQKKKGKALLSIGDEILLSQVYEANVNTTEDPLAEIVAGMDHRFTKQQIRGQLKRLGKDCALLKMKKNKKGIPGIKKQEIESSSDDEDFVDSDDDYDLNSSDEKENMEGETQPVEDGVTKDDSIHKGSPLGENIQKSKESDSERDTDMKDGQSPTSDTPIEHTTPEKKKVRRFVSRKRAARQLNDMINTNGDTRKKETNSRDAAGGSDDNLTRSHEETSWDGLEDDLDEKENAGRQNVEHHDGNIDKYDNASIQHTAAQRPSQRMTRVIDSDSE